MSHVSIYVFFTVGLQDEKLKSLWRHFRTEARRCTHTHGQKTTPLTPHRILAERLQILEGCWYRGGVFRCKFWKDVGTAEECFAASKTL